LDRRRELIQERVPPNPPAADHQPNMTGLREDTQLHTTKTSFINNTNLYPSEHRAFVSHKGAQGRPGCDLAGGQRARLGLIRFFRFTAILS